MPCAIVKTHSPPGQSLEERNKVNVNLAHRKDTIQEVSAPCGQEQRLRRGEAEERIMVPREACPQCGSRWSKRNGKMHTGKQNHRCKLCGRAFVLPPDNTVMTAEPRRLSERLLLERISLRGICRAVGVGLQWLLPCMAARFQAAPKHLH